MRDPAASPFLRGIRSVIDSGSEGVRTARPRMGGVGALAGHAMNTETEPLWLSCGMVAVLVVFVAVNLIVLKEFSFQKTIDGVRPLKELSTLPEGATFDMAGSCAVLASDCGLTPREHEIMGYLARGRNAAYV